MVEPNTPQVTPVPGAEAEAERTRAATADAAAKAEVATEAEKTAEAAKEAAAEAKAAAEAVAPPRTYSQEEWEKRESAKDLEISNAKTVASQAALQTQIAQQAQAEASAKAKDQGDVEQGLISEAEAQQRQQERQRAIQMQPRMEQMGRMMAAQDIGGRYGVNPYDLLSDQSIQTPQQMDAKAKQLAQSTSDAATKVTSDRIEVLEAEIKALKEGEPLFDQGQQGAGGPDLTSVPPEELSTLAYSPKEVARREKARKK